MFISENRSRSIWKGLSRQPLAPDTLSALSRATFRTGTGIALLGAPRLGAPDFCHRVRQAVQDGRSMVAKAFRPG